MALGLHTAGGAQPVAQRTSQENGWFLRFLADEGGATAIEYALLASGIALAIIAAVNGLATTLTGAYQNIAAVLL